MNHTLKIYSWNINWRNTHLDEVYDFVASLDFDILCLQEVPARFLERLALLPCEVASSMEWSHLERDGSKSTMYMVIISRFPIHKQTKFSFPKAFYPQPLPARGRLVCKLLGWRPLVERGSLIIEVTPPYGETVQIVSLHLVLMLQARAAEFTYALERADHTLPTIVCGDFNILEAPHVTLLNWLFGASFKDFLLWWRERPRFKKVFTSYGLKNPLQKQRTHTVSRSQLDHILVPETAEVVQKKVIPKRYGSDHNPVMVEVVLPTRTTK